MPKERSIAKRLSGGEALDSLCHQVRSKLALLPVFRGNPAEPDRLVKGIRNRLCRHEDFHSHRGYHGYSAKVTIGVAEGVAGVNLRFTPAMSYGRPPLNDEFTVEGKFPDLHTTIDIPVRPPNAVRMEAELPLPVEVEEQGQIVEKMVPAVKYKGKLKPGTQPPKTTNTDTPAFKGRLEMPEGAVEQYGIQGR